MTTEDVVTGASTSVEVLVDVRVEQVWAVVTDLSRTGEWSPECYYAAWLDGASGPAVGAQFEARNRFPNGMMTEVVCLVTAAEPARVFEWEVRGDPAEEPLAVWRYELEPRGEQTVIRQSFTHGPGDSGMRSGAEAVPERAQKAVQRRLDQLSRNMRVTIAAMMQSVRDAGLRA